MTEQLEPDFLVIVDLPYGAGSWARGRDRDQTIERCKRILKSDWKSMYKFKKGLVVKANVLDMTGLEDCEWGDRGIWLTNNKGERQPFPRDRLEIVEMVY